MSIILGDCHGCLKTVLALLEKCPKEQVYSVGDLIDRGNDSDGVVKLAIEQDWQVVRGNHEQMAIDASRDSEAMAHWLTQGGNRTMANFNFDRETYLKHVMWFRKLPKYIVPDESEGLFNGRRLFISHAGLAEEAATVEEAVKMAIESESIFWNRPTVNYIVDYKEIFQVFGHTVQKNEPKITAHYACIDGGCVFEDIPYGNLFALQWPSMQVYSQRYIG